MGFRRRTEGLLRITLVLCQKASLQADVRHVQGANIEAQRGAHHRNTDAKLAQFCKTCRITHTRKHRTDSHKRSSSPCEGKIMIDLSPGIDILPKQRWNPET